jgi:hypothetical protein
MKAPLTRCTLQLLHRFNESARITFIHLHLFQVFILAVFLSPRFVQAQPFSLAEKSARSISGQFIVFAAPRFSTLAGSAKVAADTNFVRLEPALLAVSAERLKDALGRQLEIKPGMPWRGQIYLVIHPALSLDENVNIISKRRAQALDYRVELPDVLSRTRMTRALTGVLLLEMANRDAREHSAEVPAWLVEGFAQQLLATGSPEFILSTPDAIVNGLPVTRLDVTRHGLHPLTGAQRVLQSHPPLTFEQLSWPSGAQLAGDDGGVYWASAQLFVDSLLELKNGPAQLRTLLGSLPQFYNWQLAFQSAFRANFSSPLNVEKWWALQVASYAVRDPGPLWTSAASRARLDQLLSVPVEARAGSNSLPAYADISLQTVIRSMDYDRQKAILQIRLRDLGLAQYRMAPQFAALAGEYRRAIASYLGESPAGTTAPTRPGHGTLNPQMANPSRTLKRLDELDARRRQMESSAREEKSIQPGLAPLPINPDVEGRLDTP